MEQKNLNQFRLEIDQVDQQIISALAKRFDIVKEVSKFKKENGLKPLDPKRWAEVIMSRKILAKSLGLSVAFVGRILEEIHIEALKIERKIIG